MSRRSDKVSAEELEFYASEQAFTLQVCGPAARAPVRFFYRRTEGAAPFKLGHVYVWTAERIDGGGTATAWRELADMRFSDEEQIELFMRTAARLGMDTGVF